MYDDDHEPCRDFLCIDCQNVESQIFYTFHFALSIMQFECNLIKVEFVLIRLNIFLGQYFDISQWPEFIFISSNHETFTVQTNYLATVYWILSYFFVKKRWHICRSFLPSVIESCVIWYFSNKIFLAAQCTQLKRNAQMSPSEWQY